MTWPKRPPRSGRIGHPEPMLAGPFRAREAITQGLVTKAQLRGRRFQRLFRGVYVCRPTDGRAVDLATRSRGAFLLLGEHGALAGYSAAELLQAPCAPREVPAEVVATGTGIRPRPGLIVHRDAIEPSEIWRAGGCRVTSPLRTAWDLARRLDRTEAVVAIDALARRVASPRNGCSKCARSAPAPVARPASTSWWSWPIRSPSRRWRPGCGCCSSTTGCPLRRSSTSCWTGAAPYWPGSTWPIPRPGWQSSTTATRHTATGAAPTITATTPSLSSAGKPCASKPRPLDHARPNSERRRPPARRSRASEPPRRPLTLFCPGAGDQHGRSPRWERTTPSPRPNPDLRSPSGLLASAANYHSLGLRPDGAAEVAVEAAHSPKNSATLTADAKITAHLDRSNRTGHRAGRELQTYQELQARRHRRHAHLSPPPPAPLNALEMSADAAHAAKFSTPAHLAQPNSCPRATPSTEPGRAFASAESHDPPDPQPAAEQDATATPTRHPPTHPATQHAPRRAFTLLTRPNSAPLLTSTSRTTPSTEPGTRLHTDRMPRTEAATCPIHPTPKLSADAAHARRDSTHCSPRPIEQRRVPSRAGTPHRPSTADRARHLPDPPNPPEMSADAAHAAKFSTTAHLEHPNSAEHRAGPRLTPTRSCGPSSPPARSPNPPEMSVKAAHASRDSTTAHLDQPTEERTQMPFAD